MTTDYEKMSSFESLMQAHKAARRGKRCKTEVILFEMNLSQSLWQLKRALDDRTYKISGYYRFKIHDPKERNIDALHYRDRVVQHALCDQILWPLLENRMIYDNAASRKGKGTSFAIDRLSCFLREHYKSHGAHGYFLKADFSRYFMSISHTVLKTKMRKVLADDEVYGLVCGIIDSLSPGVPLGNQTSQCFGVYYPDSMDRIIKEDWRAKYYTRYMDDGVIVHHDREFLKDCLAAMRDHAENVLKLQFNKKTQIFPISNGVDYLGFHFYLTDTGKVVRKLRRQSKKRFGGKLKEIAAKYYNNEMDYAAVKSHLAGFRGHLGQGHTYSLKRRLLENTDMLNFIDEI